MRNGNRVRVRVRLKVMTTAWAGVRVRFYFAVVLHNFVHSAFAFAAFDCER